MMRVLAALLLVLAGQAQALSCVQPDVARSFQHADASEDAYVVLLGTYSFDAAKLPQVDWDNQMDTPPETKIAARFKGLSLTADGFTRPFESAVTLNALCLGPWCASPQPDRRVLSFVQKSGEAYVFEASPCGGYGFWDPTDVDIARVEACMRGEGCETDF